MNWQQRLCHEIDDLVSQAACFLYENLVAIIVVLFVIWAMAFVHASTDFFEYCAPTIMQREPVPSDPPKNVTLWQFLELEDLYEFAQSHKLLCCLLSPTLGLVLYAVLGQRKPARRTRSQPLPRVREVPQVPQASEGSSDNQIGDQNEE